MDLNSNNQQAQEISIMPNWTIPRSAAFSALNKHMSGYPSSTQQINKTMTAALSSADETTDGYDSGGGGMISVPMPVGGVNG